MASAGGSKKGSGKKKKGGGDSPSGGGGGQKGQSEVEKEWESIQVKDLVAKLERYQQKCDVLSAENIELNERVTKETIDHHDIVKYLNDQIDSRGAEIKDLNMKLVELETTADKTKDDFELQLSELKDSTTETIEQLSEKNRIMEKKLNDLEEFRKQKEEIQQYIEKLKTTIENKKAKYHETIGEMEKKAVQDRDRLKKEMLKKVNEVVANFRKISDKQMAETTKRTIRENITINGQLTKMSKKTVELIHENDQLTEKLKAADQKIEILQQCEKDMAKKNKANVKISSMLVEKAKSHEDENNMLRAEKERETFEWEKMLADKKREYSNRIYELESELEEQKNKYTGFEREREDMQREQQALVSQLSEATGFIMRAFQEAKAEVYEDRKQNARDEMFEDDRLLYGEEKAAGQSSSPTASYMPNEASQPPPVGPPTSQNMSADERKRVLEHLLKRMSFYDISRGQDTYVDEPKSRPHPDPFTSLVDKIDLGPVLPKPVIRYPAPPQIPRRSVAAQTESVTQKLFFAENLVPLESALLSSRGKKKQLKPLSGFASTTSPRRSVNS
eukprot:Nk52_evm1s351 gene=Nk52_evmTU1s351